jgi:hypothetical protein
MTSAFVSVSAAAPTVLPGGVYNLSATSATIYGSVNPHGLSTGWGFFAGPGGTRYARCQGTLIGYAASDPTVVNPVLVSCALTALSPATTYTWVLEADNRDGRTSTPTQTFATPASSTSASATTMAPPTSVQSDWAVLSVQRDPPAPQIGDTVVFKMSMTLLSSTGSFPQNVNVQCELDAISCGSSTLPFPGPVGRVYDLQSDPWTATAGSHTLAWVISTVNDPHPENNKLSAAFEVSSSSTHPTTTTSIFSSFSSIEQTSTSSATMIGGQTTASFESSTTSSVSTVTPVGSNITELIQQNPSIVLAAIVLILLVTLALRRRPSGPTPVAHPPANAVYCRKCGNQNPTTNQFCKKCGTKLS